MDNSVGRSREPAREASSEKFRSREKGFDIVPKCLVAGKLARFEIEKFPSSSIRRRYLSSKDFFENMDILRRKSTGNVIPRTRTRKRERERFVRSRRFLGRISNPRITVPASRNHSVSILGLAFKWNRELARRFRFILGQGGGGRERRQRGATRSNDKLHSNSDHETSRNRLHYNSSYHPP